jgi:hypothetical protein
VSAVLRRWFVLRVLYFFETNDLNGRGDILVFNGLCAVLL